MERAERARFRATICSGIRLHSTWTGDAGACCGCSLRILLACWVARAQRPPANCRRGSSLAICAVPGRVFMRARAILTQVGGGMAWRFALGAGLTLGLLPAAHAQDDARTITSNGITVTFAARAVRPDAQVTSITAGDQVEVTFKVTDAATGSAIS